MGRNYSPSMLPYPNLDLSYPGCHPLGEHYIKIHYCPLLLSQLIHLPSQNTGYKICNYKGNSQTLKNVARSCIFCIPYVIFTWYRVYCYHFTANKIEKAFLHNSVHCSGNPNHTQGFSKRIQILLEMGTVLHRCWTCPWFLFSDHVPSTHTIQTYSCTVYKVEKKTPVFLCVCMYVIFML